MFDFLICLVFGIIGMLVCLPFILMMDNDWKHGYPHHRDYPDEIETTREAMSFGLYKPKD